MNLTKEEIKRVATDSMLTGILLAEEANGIECGSTLKSDAFWRIADNIAKGDVSLFAKVLGLGSNFENAGQEIAMKDLHSAFWAAFPAIQKMKGG